MDESLKMDCKVPVDFIDVCRTCLRKISDATQLFYIVTNEATTVQSVRYKLEDCIPSLDLSLTSNPVVCKDCFDAINLMHSFKENCLQYEFYIKNYAETACLPDNCVELAEMVRENEKMWLSWISPDLKPNCTLVEDNGNLECYTDSNVKQEPVEYDQTDYEPIDKEEELKEAVVKSEVKSQEYYCNDCTYNTNSKSKLLIHLQSHVVETTLLEIIRQEAEQDDESVDDDDDDYIPYSQKRHICKICKYTTDRRSKLKVHMKTHRKLKSFKKLDLRNMRNVLYKCSKCSFTTAEKQELSSHVKVHSFQKRFVCFLCGYSSNQRGNLNMHARIHTDEKLFKCEYCNYSSHQKNNLKIHTMLHTGETPYSCAVCSFRTVYKHALDVHTRIHTGEKPYKCNVCSYSSIYKQSLNVHERIHLKEKPFKCTQCSYSSCQRSNLNVHLKKFHPELGEQSMSCYRKMSITCKLCKETVETPHYFHLSGPSFISKGLKLRDLLECCIPDLNLPHDNCDQVCHNCTSALHIAYNFRMTVRSNFPSAANEDATETPVELPELPNSRARICHVCGKRLSGPSTLSIHMKIHTGVKAYLCERCGKPFRAIGMLQLHQRVHANEKRFKCALCDYGATRKAHLQSHMKVHMDANDLNECLTCGKFNDLTTS
ncbi:zinc finger protein 570-like isoform X2 [Photinus pyralis]|nr:zinc finger protein 570-like isoform X2 [Photinus pyralis]